MPLFFSYVYKNTLFPISVFQGISLAMCVIFASYAGYAVDHFSRIKGIHTNIFKYFSRHVVIGVS